MGAHLSRLDAQLPAAAADGHDVWPSGEARDGAADEMSRARAAALLDAVLANSSEAIVVVDDEGSICYATPGAALQLGYDPDAVVGSPVFSFLHPDDAETAGEIFVQRLDYDGADLGHEIRVRSAEGAWLPMLATATLLPPGDLGVAAITMRNLDTIDTVERALRRRVAVEEYCNRLSSSFMEAHTTDDMWKRLEASLGEIGMLTGAEVVTVFLDRQERGILERLGRWAKSGDDEAPAYGAVAKADFGQAGEVMLEEPTHYDDLKNAPSGPVLDHVRGLGAYSLLTTPFSTGSQRGVLVLTRLSPGPAWSDADTQLIRNVAALYGRAIQTAQAEELLALTYRRGPVAFSIRTWDGAMVECNEQYLRLLGVSRDQAATLPLSELLHPADRDWVTQRIAELHRGERDKLEHDVRICRPDGSVRWLRTRAVSLQAPGSSEPFVLSALDDVTQAHEQRVELEYAANHDPLTGVANRAALLRTIDELVSAGEPLALLAIDLDRFKGTNDSMGHVVGDDVLCAVAARLGEMVRETDLVARLGGDEFAVVAAGMAPDSAEDLADRLRRAMERPMEIDHRMITQSISVGVAVSDQRLAADELLVRADRALYAAKGRGRNAVVVFDASMHDEVMARLNMERQLIDAIANNEFEVHFQPEFRLADRQLLGAEALLRWVHPHRGVIRADEFIEVAEASGLIDELGRFALREGCRLFAETCRDVGADDLMLRVNISGREFARAELPELVRAALHDADLDPARLCLEMTETTLMDSPEIALETFSRLHELGVQFAIDDFGTGYSSLTYLKRFPVDVLKIDRGFVSDLDSDAESRAIIGSIINLAAALSLEVVAEGVETERQLELLLELGCDRGQGYLMSGALPRPALVAFLRTHH